MRPEKKLKTFIGLFIFTVTLISNSRAGSDVKTIDTARLHSMVVDNAYSLEAGREKHFAIIDARTKEEYNEAHIFSAISIPEKDFEKSIGLLPGNRGTLLVVYDNGMKSGTSRKWANKAAAAGCTNIIIYSEGFPAWKKTNMPIVPPGSGL